MRCFYSIKFGLWIWIWHSVGVWVCVWVKWCNVGRSDGVGTGINEDPIYQIADLIIHSNFNIKLLFIRNLIFSPLPGFEPQIAVVWVYEADDIPIYHRAFVLHLKISKPKTFHKWMFSNLDLHWFDIQQTYANRVE